MLLPQAPSAAAADDSLSAPGLRVAYRDAPSHPLNLSSTELYGVRDKATSKQRPASASAALQNKGLRRSASVPATEKALPLQQAARRTPWNRLHQRYQGFAGGKVQPKTDIFGFSPAGSPSAARAATSSSPSFEVFGSGNPVLGQWSDGE